MPVLSSLCLLGTRPMRRAVGMLLIIILRLRQHGRHFADAIFKCIFMNENIWFPIKISLQFVPKGLINYIPALVQIMAWRRPGDKPLSEPMMVRSPPHICVARPQWVIQSLFSLSSKLLPITLCCSAELWALWGLTTWQGGGISPGVNWIYKPSSSHLTVIGLNCIPGITEQIFLHMNNLYKWPNDYTIWKTLTHWHLGVVVVIFKVILKV